MVFAFLTVFLVVCITLFVIFLLFSLWLIHNMDKLQPAKTGYGIQKVTCSTQAAQELISQRMVCERNGQIGSQGARRKQAMVAAKKRVAYSKLKPKIYVQEGSEMIELKELGNNSPAKSTSSGDLNLNVAQAVEDVHGKDPLFKKVQLPKYKNGYQLVGNANERFVSHILSLYYSTFYALKLKEVNRTKISVLSLEVHHALKT